MGWLDNWRKLDSTVLQVPPGMRDVSRAVVVAPRDNARACLYAGILANEVHRRARVSWAVRMTSEVESDASALVVELRVDETLLESCGSEGYSLITQTDEHGPARVRVAAATDRGVLFGVGRLLREMKLDFHISYAKPLSSVCCMQWPIHIVSRPQYRMRQHQVAYRPKTNSYDGFSEAMMKQEVLDLALFGTNGIEMIPPGIDDALQSPNFTVPWLDMMRAVSQWCQDLDLSVSIWYPAFFKSYEDPEALTAAHAHWHTVFGALARLDVLFVPGGDPGGRPAEQLFRAVRLQAEFMRAHYFPACEVWVSSQYGLSTSVDLGLTEPWVPLVAEQLWMEALRGPGVRDFVDGAVYGPWSCAPIDEFRAQLPSDLPLRNYPDLCHVQTAQMPVFAWDLSFAVTNGRESINPRPREMMRVIAEQAPHTIGCGCYSEGVNDDVNKYVWTALHWGGDVAGPLVHATPEQQLDAALAQYVSLLMEQPRNAGLLVQGIYALERNWRGDLLSSGSVPASQRMFAEVQASLAPRHRRNWRLNMLLFRAAHDAFLLTRLQQERAAEARALTALGVDAGTRQERSATAAAQLVGPLTTVLSAAVVKPSAASALAVVHDDSGGNGWPDETLRTALAQLDAPYAEPGMSMSSFRSPSTADALNVTLLSGAPSVTHLYGQLMALAATLYHQIAYELSVGYGGQHRQRGAYFDLAWAPLGDVAVWRRVLSRPALSDDDARVATGADDAERDACVAERFMLALRERTGAASTRVVWYASFGDEAAHELPGCLDAPTRAALPVSRVLPPHRGVALGEDPAYFTRPLVEYADASNDQVVRDLHEGRVPRCWRSYLVPIWPRTARLCLRFPLQDVLRGDHDALAALASGDDARMSRLGLAVRVTYVGADVNRHGGDWEELLREAQPTRLDANGVPLHGLRASQRHTRVLEMALPVEALRRAVEADCLMLTWEPRVPHKTTFRFVPLPIAELWIVRARGGGEAKL